MLKMLLNEILTNFRVFIFQYYYKRIDFTTQIRNY